MRPIACTLSRVDLAAQRERWTRLGMVDRTETADGLRLVFEDLPGVRGELSALVAVETECCAWASWELEGVELNVRSTGDGIATLHGMFR